MIRTKLPSDRYRDEWDRIFGEEKPTPPDAVAHARGWPTEHEGDCPAIAGGQCRCPMGNL